MIFESIFTVCVCDTALCCIPVLCQLVLVCCNEQTIEIWKVFSVNKLYDISGLSSFNKYNCLAASHLTCFSIKIGLHLNLFLEAFI